MAGVVPDAGALEVRVSRASLGEQSLMPVG
jgi:hypothetical protein